MNNRFSCLKSSGEEKKPPRRNRFQKPRTNNRWKRSKSPTERKNTFKAPKRERGGRHFRHKKRECKYGSIINIEIGNDIDIEIMIIISFSYFLSKCFSIKFIK